MSRDLSLSSNLRCLIVMMPHHSLAVPVRWKSSAPETSTMSQSYHTSRSSDRDSPSRSRSMNPRLSIVVRAMQIQPSRCVDKVRERSGASWPSDRDHPAITSMLFRRPFDEDRTVQRIPRMAKVRRRSQIIVAV